MRWVAFLGILLCAGLDAQPRVVLILRHAEKPASLDPNLTPNGCERAAALPKYFITSFEPADYLFAAGHRHVETLTP